MRALFYSAILIASVLFAFLFDASPKREMLIKYHNEQQAASDAYNAKMANGRIDRLPTAQELEEH